MSFYIGELMRKPRPRKVPIKKKTIEVGDKIKHKVSSNIGYVKKIYGKHVAVIERRDLPKVENIHGDMDYMCFIADTSNLEYIG